ncbi:MAG: hypothetical protein ABI867_30795 [Kofleriaceae bacterium]
MGRAAGQSDFVFQKEPDVFQHPIPLPPGADPVNLPRLPEQLHEASPTATRWVMTAMWILFGLLAILTLVGPHIPGGE